MIIIDRIETIKVKTMRVISHKMMRTHIKGKKIIIAITPKKAKIRILDTIIKTQAITKSLSMMMNMQLSHIALKPIVRTSKIRKRPIRVGVKKKNTIKRKMKANTKAKTSSKSMILIETFIRKSPKKRMMAHLSEKIDLKPNLWSKWTKKRMFKN